jgi:hypothetical protein
MDNVAIRLLITISRFKHSCGTARKQSLTIDPQARASCAQAVGAWPLAVPVLALACVAAPDPPPCARGWGQADAAP